MSEELKPCPFCGGKASVKAMEYGDDYKVWGVFCESDLESEYGHGHFLDNFATEAEAIAAWNTRTPEQAIAATLGGVECVPHGEWESISQTQEVRHIFCECGHELGMDRRDSLPFHRTSLCAIPNYCEECGRKIRKAVKR